MKVTEHIKSANGRNLVSFEILPPLKGGGMQDIFKILDPLMEFKPPFIDVTYHREEYVYNKNSNGYYEKTSIRKRPGTVGICTAIMHHYNVDAVPHLICGGFTREDTENALIDLNFLGIDNVLALRGDPRRFDNKFIPEEEGHKHASGLVQQIDGMNHGKYLDENIANGYSTDFCIGVAGYPEKHFESPNMDIDLMYLKKKIDAGADYIVTQMFFDNAAYFEFERKCRAIGIEVPIIPGIKPITKKSQLTSIPRTFYIDFPEDLVVELQKTEDKEKIKAIGKAWTINQCKELIQHGVPCLHFYTMFDNRLIHDIVSEII